MHTKINTQNDAKIIQRQFLIISNKSRLQFFFEVVIYRFAILGLSFIENFQVYNLRHYRTKLMVTYCKQVHTSAHGYFLHIHVSEKCKNLSTDMLNGCNYFIFQNN